MINFIKNYFTLAFRWFLLYYVGVYTHLYILKFAKLTMIDFLSSMIILLSLAICIIMAFPMKRVGNVYLCSSLFGWKKLDLHNISIIFKTNKTILVKIDKFKLLQYRIVVQSMFFENVLDDFIEDVNKIHMD